MLINNLVTKMKDISSSLSVYNSFMVFNKTFRHILYFSLPTICLIWLHNSHAASGTHVPSLMCEWIKPVTFRNCLKSETTTLRSRTCSSCHKMSTTIEITKNYPQTRFSSYSLVFFFFQGIRGGVCVKSPPPHFLCMLAVTCSFYSPRQVLNKWFCSVTL